MNWTKPYYGVSHCLGLPRRYRLTINDSVDRIIARVYLVDRDSDTPMTPIKEEFTTPDKAREIGEKWANELLKNA